MKIFVCLAALIAIASAHIVTEQTYETTTGGLGYSGAIGAYDNSYGAAYGNGAYGTYGAAYGSGLGYSGYSGYNAVAASPTAHIVAHVPVHTSVQTSYTPLPAHAIGATAYSGYGGIAHTVDNAAYGTPIGSSYGYGTGISGYSGYGTHW